MPVSNPHSPLPGPSPRSRETELAELLVGTAERLKDEPAHVKARAKAHGRKPRRAPQIPPGRDPRGRDPACSPT